jgi:hypothetical protein
VSSAKKRSKTFFLFHLFRVNTKKRAAAAKGTAAAAERKNEIKT